MNAAANATVHSIDARDLADVEARLAKLAKRAARLGAAMPTMSVVGQHPEWEQACRDEKGRPYTVWTKAKTVDGGRPTGGTRTVLHLDVQGVEAVKASGWTFCAVLDFELGEGNALIRKVPSFEGDVPAVYRDRGNVCDHCKSQRKRSRTFLLQHEDGRWTQVGSTCLADFLGHDVREVTGTLEVLAAFSDIFEEFELDEFGGRRTPTQFDLEHFLAHVAMQIRLDGWVSRKRAEAEGLASSTADWAVESMMAEFKARRG